MQFKRTLRNILGTEYKYHDIENAITFSDKENKDDKLDLNEWITTLKVMLRRQGYKNYRPKLKGESNIYIYICTFIYIFRCCEYGI